MGEGVKLKRNTAIALHETVSKIFQKTVYKITMFITLECILCLIRWSGRIRSMIAKISE
jgi:hypothetical protein